MRLSITVAALFSVASVGVAHAEPRFSEVETRRVDISYADLDLNQRDDAVRLLSRVNRAARRACGGRPTRLSPSENAAFRACATQAAEQAVAQLAHPVVTAVYVERGGRAPGRLASAE